MNFPHEIFPSLNEKGYDERYDTRDKDGAELVARIEQKAKQAGLY